MQAVTEGHSFSIRSCCSFFVTLVLCQVVKKDLWPSSQLKSTTHLSPCLLRAKMDRLQPFGNTDLNLDWYLLPPQYNRRANAQCGLARNRQRRQRAWGPNRIRPTGGSQDSALNKPKTGGSRRTQKPIVSRSMLQLMIEASASRQAGDRPWRRAGNRLSAAFAEAGDRRRLRSLPGPVRLAPGRNSRGAETPRAKPRLPCPARPDRC